VVQVGQGRLETVGMGIGQKLLETVGVGVGQAEVAERAAIRRK
jgi:hypothetical protein